MRQTSASGIYNKCRWVGTALASNDYDVEVDGRSDQNAVGFGPFGRGAVSTTVTYYTGTGFGNDAFYLLEITGGNEAILLTGGSCTASTTYNIRLRCDGSSLTVYVNDVINAGPYTDTTLTTGAVGCMAFGGLNGTNNWEDNFLAADLAAECPGQSGRHGRICRAPVQNFVGNKYTATLTWEGQTDFSPVSSTVFLQIYNCNSTTWETVDSDNTSGANTDFTLTADIANLTNYKDGSSVISCRVYQQAV